MLRRCVEALEVLGGARAVPEAIARRAYFPIARGLWWGLLMLLAWAFAGRATKFVYVDF
jgi:hypothetical protein